MRKIPFFQSGQALITLIFFMVISVTIISAAVIMIYLNSQSESKLQAGDETYVSTESGAENALLRLLRDPSYTGESMTVGNATVTTSVSGSNPVVITSIGKEGSNNIREIQVTAGYTNNVLTVSSWKEITQ